MRNAHIDILKTIAIVAVVIGHIVPEVHSFMRAHDVFFVIAGYFSVRSIEKCTEKGLLSSYFSFVFKRVWRLLPIVVLAGVLCLMWGYWVMLPDAYDNLAQSVVASNLFANNVLQAITTRDYWNVANDFKPLMHTWYLGVLMQFYVTIPLLLLVVKRCFKKIHQSISVGLLVAIAIISLVIYIADTDSSKRYYFLQFRLFEFCLGSLFYYISTKLKFGRNAIWCTYATIVLYCMIISAMMIGYDSIPTIIRLLILDTCVAVFLLVAHPFQVKSRILNVLTSIGVASLSVFMWHQIVIGFARYSFTCELTSPVTLCIILLLIGFLSYLTYKFVEPMKARKASWAIVISAALISTLVAFHIYNIAGTVRDVPELESRKGDGYGRMWAQYCDRCWDFDGVEFTESGDKQRWLVIGSSFGRDFINVILESEVADKVEISYTSDIDINRNKRLKGLVSEADAVFLGYRVVCHEDYLAVKSICKKDTRLFVVGTKYYGLCNGQVYFHRNDEDYLQSTVELDEFYRDLNERNKKLYGDFYIDLVGMTLTEYGRIKVFTDDGKYISQDCLHLTHAGACYYARQIDWEKFF